MFSYIGKRILIVDDQRSFHVMLKTILTNQGAKKIVFADNADSAAKIAQNQTFDIYLIDYNLGLGKNGSQLLNYLRQNELIPSQALCFIITGDSNKGMVLTAIETPPDDYLMKPFSQTQLLNRLKKAHQKKIALADIFSAIDEKNYEQAIQLCKKKIQEKTKFSGLCSIILADIFITIKELSSAEDILIALFERRPLTRVSITLGKVYYLQKRYPDAIDMLQEVVQAKPLEMEAYQWLSRSYQAAGELDKALELLIRVANITHHSIEKHQEVALLANEIGEKEVVVNSYQSILHLSRGSFYPDPCHLANYIRSIFSYADTQEEMMEKRVILKKVSSVLYQSQVEEGRNKDFDFSSYEQICQAKVFFAQGEQLKAKRRILNTLKKNETPLAEMDNTLLCESLFALLDIGEFDYADPYLEELGQRDIINPATQITIQERTGELLEKRIDNFKGHNRLGIQAFKERQYSAALEHFNQALMLEPLNSGALLNKIQVYIQLVKQSTRAERTDYINHCQASFTKLSNTQLPVEHAKRYKQLNEEFLGLKRN